MSGDLKTQVRDYTEYFMGTVERIDLEEIKERPLRLSEGPVPPLASPSRRRGWLVAVAGAVAVLVLGLLTFMTRPTAPEAPVLSQPSPSPTVTTPAPVPTTPTEESASGWSRVSHDDAVFGGEGRQGMESVTVGGPGLVAVGGDVGDAAVWTSVDGITWSRVPHDETVFGGGAVMSSVTAGGPGLVAVGDADDDAAVWTSVDGITWSRVPHDESVFGGTDSQAMLSVTVGGPGLVAVGWDGQGEPDSTFGMDAAVWTSVDGLTWSRVPHDESVFGGTDSQVMLSVTVGGPGLVAVGWDGQGEPGYTLGMDAAVWTSVDGIAWSRVPNDESVFGGMDNPAMVSVTAGGPGLVAVGVGTSALAWTSVDGLTWSQVPYDMAIFGGLSPGAGPAMTSVTAGGPGLVAVGESAGAVVWTSVDGITWSRVHDRSVFGYVPSMLSVTAGGPGLVAVGTDGGDAAVWVKEDD